MKWLFLALSLFSCKSKSNQPSVTSSKETVFLEKPYFQGIDCNFNNERFKHCELVRERLSYARKKTKSSGQRFMILDTRFFPKTQLLRHQNKVLGIYRHDLNGFYQKQFPMVSYPTILDDYKQELQNQNDQFFHDHRIEFNALMKKVSIFHYDTPDFPYHHGETIFDFISEKNPHSQIVLANYPRAAFHLICDSSNNFEGLKKFLHSSVQSLKRIIKKNDINFVTIAIGKNIVWAKESLIMGCPTQRFTKKEVEEYLKVYARFHEKLAKATPDTLFFQSTENLVRTSVNLKNYPTACSEQKNIIRVSYVNSLSKVFLRDGEEPKSEFLNPQGPRKLKKCNDLYINGRANEKSFQTWLAQQGYSGMDVTSNFSEIEELRKNQRQPRWYDETTFYYLRGFEKRPELLMSSSWATAVAASFANYLINEQDYPIQSLKSFFHGNAFDPLFHNQFLGGIND